MRTATLVIVGNFAQALGAAAEHRILSARSVLEDPKGVFLEGVQRIGPGDNGRCRCLTRLRVDADYFGAAIAQWMHETHRGGKLTGVGALVRVQLAPETA